MRAASTKGHTETTKKSAPKPIAANSTRRETSSLRNRLPARISRASTSSSAFRAAWRIPSMTASQRISTNTTLRATAVGDDPRGALTKRHCSGLSWHVWPRPHDWPQNFSQHAHWNECHPVNAEAIADAEKGQVDEARSTKGSCAVLIRCSWRRLGMGGRPRAALVVVVVCFGHEQKRGGVQRLASYPVQHGKKSAAEKLRSCLLAALTNTTFTLSVVRTAVWL